MYPFLFPEVFGDTIAMYDLLLLIGIFAMVIYIIHRLENNDGFTRKQTNRLLVLLGVSLLFALLFSYLFDGVFHSIKKGELTFGSISLGGRRKEKTG